MDMNRLRARVARSIDRVVGSRTRVHPMTQPAGGYIAGAPDPERPVFEATGVVAITTRNARREGSGARSAASADVIGASHRVSFAEAALAGNVPPRRGDRVELLDEPGSPILKVSHVEPAETAHGRHIVHLAKV